MVNLREIRPGHACRAVPVAAPLKHRHVVAQIRTVKGHMVEGASPCFRERFTFDEMDDRGIRALEVKPGSAETKIGAWSGLETENLSVEVNRFREPQGVDGCVV